MNSRNLLVLARDSQDISVFVTHVIPDAQLQEGTGINYQILKDEDGPVVSADPRIPDEARDEVILGVMLCPTLVTGVKFRDVQPGDQLLPADFMRVDIEETCICPPETAHNYLEMLPRVQLWNEGYYLPSHFMDLLAMLSPAQEIGVTN